MADRREQILSRLVEIAEGLPGVAAVYRNRSKADDDKKPAVVILDADEAVASGPAGTSRASSPASIVEMTPQVFIHVAGSGSSAGPAVNEWRAAWLKAVLTDAGLRALVGSNGSIRYVGLATAFGWGRSMDGELGIEIAFAYPLIPSEL